MASVTGEKGELTMADTKILDVYIPCQTCGKLIPAGGDNRCLTCRLIDLALEPKLKWIPVTERLPEETRVPKDVLVYHKLGNCGMYVDRAWYDSDKNKWRSALSMNMKVTHWMQMPEPPQRHAATPNNNRIEKGD
jgi:hypothetical protein